MRKRYAWKHTKTPWDGQPGFWPAVNRFFYLWEGPAQLGDSDEDAPQDQTNAVCPICAQPMSEHVIERGGPGNRTLIHCPTPAAPDDDVPADR